MKASLFTVLIIFINGEKKHERKMTSELNYYGQVAEGYRQLKHDLDCFNADRNEVELIRSRYYRKIDEALRLGQYSGMGDLQKAQDYINVAKEELKVRTKIHAIPKLLSRIYWEIDDTLDASKMLYEKNQLDMIKLDVEEILTNHGVNLLPRGEGESDDESLAHTIPKVANKIYWEINDLHLSGLIEQLQKFAKSAPVNDGSLTSPEKERLWKLGIMRIELDKIQLKAESILITCGATDLLKKPHDDVESPVDTYMDRQA